jgi:Arc/MetJ-type ribon-helix-helix transcriptional regulator
MKVSISIPQADVEFLDSYVHSRGMESRSAVVLMAVRMLRDADLADAYEDAWESWAESGDASAWETAAADGLAS